MNKSAVLCSIVYLTASIHLFGFVKKVEELSVYYKKETIGSQIFIYREDLVDGVRKEAWTINGNVVDIEDYEEQLWKAEKELRKQNRIKQTKRRREMQKVELQLSFALYQKLLRLEIDRIESVLNRFDDYRLTPFLVFDEEFSKEQFEKIEMELLSEAKNQLNGNVEDGSTNGFKVVIDRLDGVSDRLSKLFHDSVNNAIKMCDDTKLLKELLGLLSIA